MKGFLIKGSLAIVTLLISVSCVGATWNITYPRPVTGFDQRTNYPVQLLALAFDQTGVRYKLTPSDRIFMQSKALKQLSENRELNVVWSSTDTSREKDFLPIRIPLFKGLIGWRIFLIHEKDQDKFSRITQLDQLRGLSPVQGHDWPDTKILQANGFNVETTTNYTELFNTVLRSQSDFFPRSVVEAWAEVDNLETTDKIMVERSLGVRYPVAMYFFVNKNNSILARLLEDGLEKAIANGKFDELFLQVHAEYLEKSKLGERNFFQLENPLLPEATPLHRPELWYQAN